MSLKANELVVWLTRQAQGHAQTNSREQVREALLHRQGAVLALQQATLIRDAMKFDGQGIGALAKALYPYLWEKGADAKLQLPVPKQFRLPYPKMYLELPIDIPWADDETHLRHWRRRLSHVDNRMCLYCWQDDDQDRNGIYGFVWFYLPLGDGFNVLAPSAFRLEMMADHKIEVKAVQTATDNDMEIFTGVSIFLGLFLAILEEPQQVMVQTQTWPEKMQRTRAKHGKEKLFDYHILELCPDRPIMRSAPQGGTHASPREHERRGSWCYRRDAQGNIVFGADNEPIKWWRNATVVNRGKGQQVGRVYKDYKVDCHAERQL